MMMTTELCKDNQGCAIVNLSPKGWPLSLRCTTTGKAVSKIVVICTNSPQNPDDVCEDIDVPQGPWQRGAELIHKSALHHRDEGSTLPNDTSEKQSGVKHEQTLDDLSYSSKIIIIGNTFEGWTSIGMFRWKSLRALDLPPDTARSTYIHRANKTNDGDRERESSNGAHFLN